MLSRTGKQRVIWVTAFAWMVLGEAAQGQRAVLERGRIKLEGVQFQKDAIRIQPKKTTTFNLRVHRIKTLKLESGATARFTRARLVVVETLEAAPKSRLMLAGDMTLLVTGEARIQGLEIRDVSGEDCVDPGTTGGSGHGRPHKSGTPGDPGGAGAEGEPGATLYILLTRYTVPPVFDIVARGGRGCPGGPGGTGGPGANASFTRAAHRGGAGGTGGDGGLGGRGGHIFIEYPLNLDPPTLVADVTGGRGGVPGSGGPGGAGGKKWSYKKGASNGDNGREGSHGTKGDDGFARRTGLAGAALVEKINAYIEGARLLERRPIDP